MVTPGAMVEVADLRVRYGPREVLKGISLEIRQNEVLGIIGPAQSGKTTLLRVLNRTLDDVPGVVITGTVKVDGEEVRQVKDVFALRRKIGMVAPLPVGLPFPSSITSPSRRAWRAFEAAANLQTASSAVFARPRSGTK